MKPTEQRIHLIAHRTSLRGTTNPAALLQDSCPAISELPLLVQAEASKFLRLINKVLGRLNSVVTGLCDGYLEELHFVQTTMIGWLHTMSIFWHEGSAKR